MEKMTKEEIKKREERQHKKLVAQMGNMQQMWIPIHRMSTEEIEALDKLELESQHRKHTTLWTEFKSKPIAQYYVCLVEYKQVSMKTTYSTTWIQWNGTITSAENV